MSEEKQVSDQVGEKMVMKSLELTPDLYSPVEAAGYTWTYSHVALIAITPYDFSITFGEYDSTASPEWADAITKNQKPPKDATHPRLLKKVSVTVSPEHARRIHHFLGKKIEEWESLYGEKYRKTLDGEVSLLSEDSP